MKNGLVLEGGAMRGLFTAGVLDVFLENSINFDGCVGTSAGAVFGCNFKSRQNGRTLRYNLKYCQDKRYISISNLIFTGDLYGRKFCYEDIPNYLDPFDTKTYIENPMDFYVCCTDIEKGKPIYHNCKNGNKYDIEWMRASASMPLVSKIVEIDGQKLLDGGITDSVPIRFLESKGYEKNVVILTQPRTYRKKSSKMIPAMSIVLKKYPNTVLAMSNRHLEYNETLSYIRKQKRENKAFVIQPPQKLPVSRTERDPEKLLQAYNIGRKEAIKNIDKVKLFLKN